MIRKFISYISIVLLILLPTLSLAMDKPCSAGDNNPFCSADMRLDTSNRPQFCANFHKQNSFAYSAVKGAKIMRAPCNGSWACIESQIKRDGANFACAFQRRWCHSHYGTRYNNDCDNVIFRNCMADDNFFLSQRNCGN